MEDNCTYFTRRAAQERLAADNAQGKARLAHQEMAERYSLLAEAAEEPERTEPAVGEPAALIDVRIGAT